MCEPHGWRSERQGIDVKRPEGEPAKGKTGPAPHIIYGVEVFLPALRLTNEDYLFTAKRTQQNNYSPYYRIFFKAEWASGMV